MGYISCKDYCFNGDMGGKCEQGTTPSWADQAAATATTAGPANMGGNELDMYINGLRGIVDKEVDRRVEEKMRHHDKERSQQPMLLPMDFFMHAWKKYDAD